MSVKKKPKILILNITEKCNSRCVMCGIWKKENPQELDIQHLEDFLKRNSTYLDQITTAGFTGGEPFLANDYLKTIKLLVKYLPGLKSFGHPTNALLPDFNIKKIKEALKIIPKNVFYGIGVSLDGIGKKQEEIRGIKNYFQRTKDFIEKADKSFSRFDNFYVSLTTTVSRNNLNQIEEISDFAKKVKLRITFRPAMTVISDYINNKDSSGWQLRESDRKTLRKRFQRLYQQTKNEYYNFIIKLEEGEKRAFPCPFKDEGFILNPDGKIYMCLFSNQGHLGSVNDLMPDFFYSPNYLETQKRLIKNVCNFCSAECHTVRSSNFKRVNYLEGQLQLLMTGNLKEFKENLNKNKNYVHNRLLRNIADFNSKKFKVSLDDNLNDEKKIIFNTKLGKYRYKINSSQRNNIRLIFSQSNLLDVFLNLAKYYYVTKIYFMSEIYLNIIKKYFKKEIARGRFKEQIETLEKRIKLI